MAESAPVKAILHVSGIVQGVGFRPFVARLAAAHHLSGSVCNEMGRVTIEAFGTKASVELFLEDIKAKAPPAATITEVQRTITSFEGVLPGSFQITKSLAGSGESAMPAPDFPVCEDCLREMDTSGDIRFQNPFISCTHCGPRFSILHALPYDRMTTSMCEFSLCPVCAAQYETPADRRYHAQTICCNTCGPHLFYTDRSSRLTDGDAIAAAVSALKGGEIVAVKGIGGYHLACSPFVEKTVAALRALKNREQKPFAVMFKSLSSLDEYCERSPAETRLLTSPPRPIVLLERKPSAIAKAVYAASPSLGAFLPYTPLQHLLLQQTGPLIMTSANPSSLPIIKDDTEMLNFLTKHSSLRGVLAHDRPILRRLDDSVAFVVNESPCFLRRARGYVPLAIPLPENHLPFFACGAQEKNTVCLYQNGYGYLSAEIGDLDTCEIEAAYRETIRDMQILWSATPTQMVCDMHPEYASSHHALSQGLPVLPVQHHHAHIASVMAEHRLTEPVIGIAFDGTGYGADGTIWGGEFLIATPFRFTRAAHLKPASMLGGDSSILQGWKSAACLLWDAGIQNTDDDRFALVASALANGVNTYLSSSIGRLFDAVSSILGICHESGYGGQCAIELEYAASRYLLRGDTVELPPLPFSLAQQDDCTLIDFAPCLRELYTLAKKGGDGEALAWRFHMTVCDMIAAVCRLIREETGLQTVALSGGVFANRLLLQRIVPLLQKNGFTVYRNQQVPAGDGGISLGQAYVALETEKAKEADFLCVSPSPEN